MQVDRWMAHNTHNLPLSVPLATPSTVNVCASNKSCGLYKYIIVDELKKAFKQSNWIDE